MNKGLKGLLRWQYLIPIFLASFTSVSALALAAVTAPSSVFAFQAAQLRRVPTTEGATEAALRRLCESQTAGQPGKQALLALGIFASVGFQLGQEPGALDLAKKI